MRHPTHEALSGSHDPNPLPHRHKELMQLDSPGSYVQPAAPPVYTGSLQLPSSSGRTGPNLEPRYLQRFHA